MTAELSVVCGIGIISALLGYFAFELRESHETMAWFLFFLSITFLDILIFVITQIAAAEAYVNVIQIGLTVLLWLNILLALYMMFGLLGSLFARFWEWLMNTIAGRRRKE